jgi:hypothetical protein
LKLKELLQRSVSLGGIREDPNLKEISSSKEMEDASVEMKTDDDYTLSWILLAFNLGW